MLVLSPHRDTVPGLLRTKAKPNVPWVEGIHMFRGGQTEAEFHAEFSPLGFQQAYS